MQICIYALELTPTTSLSSLSVFVVCDCLKKDLEQAQPFLRQAHQCTLGMVPCRDAHDTEQPYQRWCPAEMPLTLSIAHQGQCLAEMPMTLGSTHQGRCPAEMPITASICSLV